MAIGWVSLLKTVPWADVISNAPAVADGAKKLWNVVARKSPSAPAPDEAPPAALSPEAQAIAQMQVRLGAIETTVAELHSQMLDSSELIKALTGQNEALIKRAESSRIRLVWLTGAVIIAGTLAAISLAVTFAR